MYPLVLRIKKGIIIIYFLDIIMLLHFWVEDLLNGNGRNFTIPDISKYKKITLRMFLGRGLAVAGVAGAWAGVMEGDSNDSKPRRITLYYMFRENLF